MGAKGLDTQPFSLASLQGVWTYFHSPLDLQPPLPLLLRLSLCLPNKSKLNNILTYVSTYRDQPSPSMLSAKAIKHSSAALDLQNMWSQAACA